MDLQDVSNDKYFVEKLEMQKLGLRVDRKSEGLIPRDRASRAKLIKEQEARIKSGVETHNSFPGSLFLLPQYAPSIAPLGGLKKVLIKDLRLETHHRGLYIMLRVVTRPFKKIDLVTVVEDETKDVVLLQLYHQEYENLPFAFDIARTRSVCIVKEPYFKIANTGIYTLRVDHVSDLIWLSEFDERLPKCWCLQFTELDKTANDWKMEGDADFTSGQYHGTVEK